MDESKYDGTHYLIMYITGYAFYFYQIYTQLLFSQYGVEIVIPFSLGFLLLPLIIFYVCKRINSKKIYNPKIKFLLTCLNLLYFSIIGLITLNYVAVMIHNYYYQNIQCYVIAFFLIIPLIYILFKKSKVYYSLSFILFAIFLFFKLLYASNHEVSDLYPLFNTLNITKPLQVIILTIPLFIEPAILLVNTNFIEDKKVNTKLIVIIAAFISLFGIYTIVRETMEFGLLLNNISFPYFESCKYLSIKSNFDNIDYYYLFSITIALFSRLPMVYFNFKDHLKLKSKGILAMIALTVVAFYYIQKKLEFYQTIIVPTLIICSTLLIIAFITSLFVKRRNE